MEHTAAEDATVQAGKRTFSPQGFDLFHDYFQRVLGVCFFVLFCLFITILLQLVCSKSFPFVLRT